MSVLVRADGSAVADCSLPDAVEIGPFCDDLPGSSLWSGWRTVPRGSVVLVWTLRKMSPVWGLGDRFGEVVFWGVRERTEAGRRWCYPVFAAISDTSKRSDRLRAWGVLADDLEAASRFRQSVARQRGEEQLAALFGSFAKAQRRHDQVEAARQRRADRDRDLASKAAAVGCTLEDLKAGIELWDRLRRKRYPVGCCLLCGRTLTDPASIVSGVGPECIQRLPRLRAAVRAKVVDIGRLRWNGEHLVRRFETAGARDLADLLRASGGVEQWQTGLVPAIASDIIGDHA